MLNINRLRIFREVADRGTIAAAAEALYLTAPAASHQLMVLEQEVGVPLLERTARSVRLTEAGKRLAQHAETILADCETALADVAAFSKEVTGTVRLALFQTGAQSVGLPAIAALKTRYPSLEVVAADMESARAIPALRAGQLEVALGHDWDFVPVADDPGLEHHYLFTEPVVALLPPDHPLAGSPVRLKDLGGERWCVATESAMSRKAVQRAANLVGFEPRVVLESNYFRAIGTAVEAGLGVGIAPAMTDLRGLRLAIQPLAEPPMTRRIFAAVRKGSSEAPAIRAVLDALIEAADALPQRVS